MGLCVLLFCCEPSTWKFVLTRYHRTLMAVMRITDIQVYTGTGYPRRTMRDD